jgi:hypothetical protein
VAKARAGTTTRGDAPFNFANKIDVGPDTERKYGVSFNSGLVESIEGAYRPAKKLIKEDLGPPESEVRRNGTDYMSTRESGKSNAWGMRLGQVTWLLAIKELTIGIEETWIEA